MAEGVRDIFSLLRATIRKHGQQLETVRLRNAWVDVDPGPVSGTRLRREQWSRSHTTSFGGFLLLPSWLRFRHDCGGHGRHHD